MPKLKPVPMHMVGIKLILFKLSGLSFPVPNIIFQDCVKRGEEFNPSV
jgi:hypothetical protein